MDKGLNEVVYALNKISTQSTLQAIFGFEFINKLSQTTEDHAEGKPSSETLNKAKEKIKDALD